MKPLLKVLLIGNLSDTRCGFQNYTQQMITALRRSPQVDLAVWDGTYPQVYARQQLPDTPYLGLLPPDAASYDVIHLIWHAMTMNHYNGVDWAGLAALPGGGPLLSWFDGGPSDAYCPFESSMQVKWSDYPKAGYHHVDYPVPDWVDGLPDPDPQFTVGASSVRGDGVAEIRDICQRHGWAMNLPTPGVWLSLEDEVRRLARSTVNVCWYNTPPLWHNRASAPSMLLAAQRPMLINRDPLLEHLWDCADLYHGDRKENGGPTMEACLVEMAKYPLLLNRPVFTAQEFSWSAATEKFLKVWSQALATRTKRAEWVGDGTRERLVPYNPPRS